jgi:hypothetical protein
VKNVLQERAYMALQLTMSQPRNQWHEQLLAQVNESPAVENVWPTEAKSEPVIYDWPENEVM